MSDPLVVIQATAKQTQERHAAIDVFDVYAKPLHGVGCKACPRRVSWPCPDFVAAGVVLDASTRLIEQSRIVWEDRDTGIWMSTEPLPGYEAQYRRLRVLGES